MKLVMSTLGVCICLSSFLAFIDPKTWFFNLPVVFALGCIVYGLGDICDSLKNK